MVFQFRDEAIEEDLNRTFKSQGQGNPDQYYNLSQTVVPTYAINQVAEGSGLPENLQTAWDKSTQAFTVNSATTTLTSTPGFYTVDLNCTSNDIARAAATVIAALFIYDGSSYYTIWRWVTSAQAGSGNFAVNEGKFLVFLNSGDSLVAQSVSTADTLAIWFRQVATVNGTLVNPLGYSAA
jgi:hypothetical protein